MVSELDVGNHTIFVGELVEAEVLSHKTRSFTFVPDVAGSYALYTEETTLIGNGDGSAFVEVTVNDHRVLSRLLGF